MKILLIIILVLQAMAFASRLAPMYRNEYPVKVLTTLQRAVLYCLLDILFMGALIWFIAN